jgi:hypothetical protein
MGLLAKSATKRRVLPATGPINDALRAMPQPWRTNAAIPVGAIVRATAGGVGLADARSTTARGTTSTLASSLLSLQSQLWIRAITPTHWKLTLGVTGPTGEIATDWTVELTIQDDSAEIATSAYTTSDGTLVNGDLHDHLRMNLLRAVGLAEAPLEVESNLSRESLTHPLTFTAAPTDPMELEFGIRTRLGEAESLQALTGMGFRRPKGSENRWAIGLPAYDATDFVAMEVETGRLRLHAQIRSEAIPGRRVAARGLSAFISRSVFLLRRVDDSAQYEGPPDWRPT